MPRLLPFLTAALLLAAGLFAVPPARQAPPAPGRYVLEDAPGPLAPQVTLEADGTFVFTYSALSSYLNVGTYAVHGDTLCLRTADGLFTYCFRMHGDALVFLQGPSSPQGVFGDEAPVPDGAVFAR